MSTYQINYNSFTNNDSLMILKGLADFEDIEKAEEFIQEKSWVDGKQYNILENTTEGFVCSIYSR